MTQGINIKLIQKLKEHWEELKKPKPGERFKNRYQRKKSKNNSIWDQILIISGGVLCILVGVVFLATPGPGIIMVCIGLGLIGQQSLRIAGSLDWIELKIRAIIKLGLRIWKNSSLIFKVFLITGCALILIGLGYLAYLFFINL